MKKTSVTTFLLAILLFVFDACSPKIPFTQAIRDKYKLTEADLKSIQFYLSEQVVLKRGEDLGREKGTDDGTLVIKSGKNLEEVVFKRNTACVINQVVDNSKVTMGFEDDPKKYLVFGSDGDPNGYYSIKALEWVKSRGKINYGDQTYYTYLNNQGVYLMFKMKSLKNVNLDQKVVKGKKL